MEAVAKEVTALVTEIDEFKYAGGEKTGWNVHTENNKLGCFSKSLVEKLMPETSYEMKIEGKDSDYGMRWTLKAVKVDGNWYAGDTAQARGGGGPGKADPEKLKQTKDLELIKNENIHLSVAIQQAMVMHTFNQMNEIPNVADVLKTADSIANWFKDQRKEA